MRRYFCRLENGSAKIPLSIETQETGGAAMLSELKTGPRVVGAKQVRRAVADGHAARVFLASDADPRVTSPIERLCEEKKVPVETAGSMAELGTACKIAVGSAAAAVLKRF